jgi:dihydrolipoamide dehydrogenase
MVNPEYEYDLVIFGGGSAGYVGAIRAAQLGMKVLVLDPEPLGGTCLHEGCIPTKALLEVTGFLKSVEESVRFGVTIPSWSVDPEKMSMFRHGIVDRLTRGIEFLFKKNRITRVSARGLLVAPHRVRILEETEREVRTRFILLATGSRPRSLPGLPFDHVKVVDSSDLLKHPVYSGRIAIIGGGAIGVEFADILESFGVSVTVLERESRLLPQEDSEVADILEKELSARGVTIITGVSGLTAQRGDGDTEVVLEYGEPDHRRTERVDCVLVAIGREPVTEGMGLETVGILPGPEGFLKVGPDGQTMVPDIYAAGDVAGGLLLAHKASHEAIICVESMAGQNPAPLDGRTIPRVVYTHPEVVSMGLTREQAEESGYEVREGRFPLLGNGRSLILGSRRGLFKVLSDKKTGRILGFHGIGPHVSEMIAMISIVMPESDGADLLSRAVFPHPSVSEALHEAFLDMEGVAIHR